MKKTTPLNDMPTDRLFPGHVVKPGPKPRLRGYSLHDDLGQHYSLSEVLLLAMTGELPTPAAAHAFERALIFLMDTPITTAPAHAARVTQVGKGGPTAVASVGVTALIAEAQDQIERSRAVLELIEGETRYPAPEIGPRDDAEREAVARLRAAVPWPEIGVLAHDLGLVPAVLAVLHRCGLKRPEQWLIAIVNARLTSSVTEGFGDFSKEFTRLPAQLPEVRYLPKEERR